jgi:hypothetical protein
MLGRKQHRIKELEALNGSFKAVEQYLPLAQDIGRRVVESTRSLEDDQSIGDEIEHIISDLTVEQRQAKLLELFHAANTESQTMILSRVFGDKELAHALTEERRRIIERNVHNLQITNAIEKARAEKMLNISMLPAGVILTIGLFDKEDLDAVKSSPAELAKHYEPNRIMRLYKGGDRQQLQLLEDTPCDEDYKLRPKLKVHSLIEVGSLISAHPGAPRELSPLVFYGSRLDCIYGDSQPAKLGVKDDWDDEIKLVVGQLQVDSFDVFGTQPESTFL